MVIGQSIEFYIDKNGITLGGYEATVELKKNSGEIIFSRNCQKSEDQKQFIIRIETKGLQPGIYILRIWVTDTVDGFVSLESEEEIKLVK